MSPPTAGPSPPESLELKSTEVPSRSRIRAAGHLAVDVSQQCDLSATREGRVEGQSVLLEGLRGLEDVEMMERDRGASRTGGVSFDDDDGTVPVAYEPPVVDASQLDDRTENDNQPDQSDFVQQAAIHVLSTPDTPPPPSKQAIDELPGNRPGSRSASQSNSPQSSSPASRQVLLAIQPRQSNRESQEGNDSLTSTAGSGTEVDVNASPETDYSSTRDVKHKNGFHVKWARILMGAEYRYKCPATGCLYSNVNVHPLAGHSNKHSRAEFPADITQGTENQAQNITVIGKRRCAGRALDASSSSSKRRRPS